MQPFTLVMLCVVLFTMPGCAAWKRFAYEGWGRDGWQQPERVIEAIGIRNGDRVADIGAGGGYFTLPLARHIGPDGIVYAVDIDPDMIEYLRKRAATEKLRNVEVVQATAADPGLPAAGVDVLFTCNTYHHLDDPVAYFRHAKHYLRPGGRVAILDMNGSGWFAWLFGHSTAPEKMRREMASAGYKLVAEHTFVDSQTFQVFVPGA